MASPTQTERFGLRAYLTGFALAVILTLFSFGLVAFNPFERTTTLLLIALAAVIQIGVHLHFFLHLDPDTTPRWNLIAIAFASILILIMVGGSLCIMFDLYQRMMT